MCDLSKILPPVMKQPKDKNQEGGFAHLDFSSLKALRENLRNTEFVGEHLTPDQIAGIFSIHMAELDRVMRETPEKELLQWNFLPTTKYEKDGLKLSLFIPTLDNDTPSGLEGKIAWTHRGLKMHTVEEFFKMYCSSTLEFTSESKVTPPENTQEVLMEFEESFAKEWKHAMEHDSLEYILALQRDRYANLLDLTSTLSKTAPDRFVFTVGDPITRGDAVIARPIIKLPGAICQDDDALPIDRLPSYEAFFESYCALERPLLSEPEVPKPSSVGLENKIAFPDPEHEVTATIRFANGEVTFSSMSPQKLAEAVKSMLN